VAQELWAASPIQGLPHAGVGHWVLQQDDASSTLECFMDGTPLGTSVQTNSADTGTVQIFKFATGAFTTRHTSFVHYGSKLTSAQQLILSKALYNFLTAMNVRPLAFLPERTQARRMWRRSNKYRWAMATTSMFRP
jgi:hypothetical protein